MIVIYSPFLAASTSFGFEVEAREMLEIVKGLLFGGWVLTAVLVAATERVRLLARHRRRLLNAFLVYSLGASFGAGLTQIDAWPFSTWPLVAGVLPPTITHSRLVALDARGGEHAVDYRAFQPLLFNELISWIDASFVKLDRSSQDRAALYLLELVESSRRRAVGDKGVGYFQRYLGPLQAPYFILHPRVWSSPKGPPRETLVGLRLYRETWNLEERARDPRRVTREIAYELLAR